MCSWLTTITSWRSSVISRLDELSRRIEAAAKLAGAQLNQIDGYPGWKPNMDSDLLKKSVGTYEKLFGQKAEVKIIHAGLECGDHWWTLWRYGYDLTRPDYSKRAFAKRDALYPIRHTESGNF